MVEEPTCFAPNASSTSPISVRWSVRTSMPILSSVVATLAQNMKYSAYRSREITWFETSTELIPRFAIIAACTSIPFWPERCLRPHRAGHLPDHDPGAELGEPLDVPADLACPDREPEPVGCRHPVLPVRPADADQRLGLVRPLQEDREQVAGVSDRAGRAPARAGARLRCRGYRCSSPRSAPTARTPRRPPRSLSRSPSCRG